MGSGWTQLIIFLLAFGLPALGAVWKKLEEQREKHRIEQLRQQTRQEQLRTGRVGGEPQVSVVQPTASAPPPAAADAVRKERIAQIAARRRAQLEEFRRRQLQRQGSASTASSPRARPAAGTHSGAFTAGGRPQPTASVPAAARPSTGHTVRDRLSQRKDQEQRQAESRSSRQQAPATRPKKPKARGGSTSARSNKSRHTTLNALEHESVAPVVSQPRQPRVLGTVMTRQDWRRAIVLGEVLAPPVSMRPPAEL